MQIIDGKALAHKLKQKIKIEVDTLKAEGHKVPHLAAILVGDNPASQSYVRNKVRSCDEVGFESTLIKKDESISEEELLDIVRDRSTGLSASYTSGHPTHDRGVWYQDRGQEVCRNRS